MDKRSRIKNKNNSGFTIVELLIVIVIIAVLAGIVFISYKGITNKAKEVALTSDMSNAKKALAMHYAEHGRYPDTIDCDLDEDFSNLCVDFGPDNDIDFERDPDWDDWDDEEDWEDEEDGKDPTPGPIPDDECYTIYGAVRSSEVSSFKATCVTPVAKFEGWRQISTNAYNTCGINSKGKIYCLGSGRNGILGDGLPIIGNVEGLDVRYSPTLVAVKPGAIGDKTIKFISSGQNHTCVIASNNKAYCWGWGKSGQLGNGGMDSSSLPVAVSPGEIGNKAIKTISAGIEHTCVIASDDKAYCWGNRDYGKLGDGLPIYGGIPDSNSRYSSVPVAVKPGAIGDKTIKSISSGDKHTCAIASDDKLYCWGNNNYRQVGIDSLYTYLSTPQAVSPGEIGAMPIKAISAGFRHNCAIASNNKAYCWGELDGNTAIVPSPVAIANKTIKAISSGYYRTCAISSDNKAYCWGSNFLGGLGNGETSNFKSDTPVAVKADMTDDALYGKTLLRLSSKMHSSCVIDSDGRAYCWGKDTQSPLRDGGGMDNTPVPVEVKPPKK